MPPGSNRRLKNVAELRMFAHPLRLRLFYALTTEREATASRLAELVDESVSLVSYHLRELAAHGFIEEAPRRSGDRRERWWRKTHEGFSFTASEFTGDPQARGVAVAAKRQMLAHEISRLERWIDEDHTWGDAWTDAAFSSDSLLRLTAPELAELSAELTAVVRKWAERGRAGAQDRPGEPGREHVMVFIHAFPFRP